MTNNMPVVRSHKATSAEMKKNMDAMPVNKERLQPAIQTAIREVIAAFAPRPSGDDEDRVAYLKAFAKAIDGFPHALVLEVLDYLVLHNPRNPFPPTAQDVHEACAERLDRWENHVFAYLRMDRTSGHFPGDAGIPREFAVRAAKDHVAFMQATHDDLIARSHRPDRETPCSACLIAMPEPKFATLPAEIFPEEGSHSLEAVRKARQDFAASAAQREAELLLRKTSAEHSLPN